MIWTDVTFPIPRLPKQSTSVKSLDFSSSLLWFHEVGLSVHPVPVSARICSIQFITNVSCSGLVNQGPSVVCIQETGKEKES